jgi:hypothetical protein
MAGNPQWRDHPAGKKGWRAEVAGKCGCCGTPFAIGDWLRRDDRLRITVIDGHQSAVQR